MNTLEFIEINNDDSVYGLITKLSKHVLFTHRSHQLKNVYLNYNNDTQTIKRLRIKAFEILLKKTRCDRLISDQDYRRSLETDPFVQLQKHAFVMKLKSMPLHDITMLQNLLDELEELSFDNVSVSSLLQLMVQLKTLNVKQEPRMKIFYCDKQNPVIPQITLSTSQIPLFQVYPMECFLSSDMFEAALGSQTFPIMSIQYANVRKEINFLQDLLRSKDMLAIELNSVSDTQGVMSNYVFDRASSQSLLDSQLYSEFNLHILQSDKVQDECENVHISTSEDVVTNCLCLPVANSCLGEDEGFISTCKSYNQNGINKLSNATNIQDYSLTESDIINITPSLNCLTWECLGEIESIREQIFSSETPIAILHLEKVKQMYYMPVLLKKIINSAYIQKEISTKGFMNDMKSLLLGVESDSFEYRYMTGFMLRANINVNGLTLGVLNETCREAINWGNSFKFLTHLITPDANGKLVQEGLIFKALCANIKELLLYYQTVLLRIFTHENESEKFLRLFQKVRPVATLISKIAKICLPYKRSQQTFREGSNILIRIYEEAISVTNTKIALVFYSLLKSCCEVYFRFLQKWMFEGICDDVYEEFMIKVRPSYLRNRSHKFWTKSFSICHDVVPSFLSDLANSILQCGKTVTLLRICDPKNPVCHICITEQPEIKVCLSINLLNEQLSRFKEYEKKGKMALGPMLSLSTAIITQKRLESQALNIVNVLHHTPISWKSCEDQKKRVDTVKVLTEIKNDILLSPQDLNATNNLPLIKKVQTVSSAKELLQLQCETQGEFMIGERSRSLDRANVLNYYENLVCDINKRRARSQWRIKRMKLFDERIDALKAAVQDTRHRQKVSSGIVKSVSSTGTSISVHENENNTEKSCRTLMSDTVEVSSVDAFEEDTTHIRRNNTFDNGKNDPEYFEASDTINTSTLFNLSSNKYTTEDHLNDNVKSLIVNYTNHSATIERPTCLNINKTDNLTRKCEIENISLSASLQYVMTPNNNQLATKEMEFAAVTDSAVIEAIPATIAYTNSMTSVISQNCNLETPMSCTTDDNFTSSVASPVSRTYNMEDTSPTESSINGRKIPSNSCLTSMSSFTMKKDSTFSDLFEMTRDDVANKHGLMPVSSNMIDIEMIDHISLKAYLEKSICIPLRIQSQLINNAVIKYFLNEENLLSHLHSLRSYYFLLNGEFAKSLTDSLYARLYEICTPIELFNSATLTNLLERALVNSFNNVYINSELLSLSATDTPAELHISDPTALDCLSLNYKVNWPLNIILDDTVMEQYCKVFKFLITSGRVSWVLQEDFNIMKRRRNEITSEQYHKLQLYRHAMTQFMNALHNYLTCSVLHASWAEFEKDLATSITVDDIYLSHINYIKRILSRCMLNSRGEKVRICLNNVFKVILKFHNRIRSQGWITKSTGSVYPNFKKLEQMYGAFCELRAYMSHVALKLATSGYQPHLMHFLNALNINQNYDLTVKTSRVSVTPGEIH